MIDWFQIYPDPELEQQILALPIRCIHSEEGCRWTGQMKQLQVGTGSLLFLTCIPLLKTLLFLTCISDIETLLFLTFSPVSLSSRPSSSSPPHLYPLIKTLLFLTS